MLCNVNAQRDVNIAMYGNGNKNVITEKKNQVRVYLVLFTSLAFFVTVRMSVVLKRTVVDDMTDFSTT